MADLGARDPLFAALDPLVRAQTLTTDQANQVYRAVAGIVSGPTSRSSARPSATWSRPSVGTAFGVLGAGLLASAFLVSYGLALDDLSWKPFAGMIVPIAAFAMVVAVTEFAQSRDDQLAALAAVSGALAVTGTALTVSTGGDSGWLTYASALVLVAGGVVGYTRSWRDIFVVPAVAGGLLLVGKACAVLVDSGDAGESDALFYGVALLVYGVAVAASGWRFPCRQLAGVLGGSIAVGSMALVIIANGFTGAFSLSPSGDVHISYRSDTVIALVLGLVGCAALAAGYATRRDAGLLVVAGVGSALLPALAVPFLTQKHPLQLAAIFVALGSGVLAAGVATARVSRRTAPAHHAAPTAR